MDKTAALTGAKIKILRACFPQLTAGKQGISARQKA